MIIPARLAACVLAIVAAFSACEMSAEVTTSVSAGGRTTFGFALAFDQQLLAAAGKTAQGAKALQDLGKIPAEFSSGGWTFRKSQPSGGLRLETRRRFPTVEALNKALNDLRKDVTAASSATTALVQVFKEFEVQRTPGFLKSETRVSGVVDVTPASLLGGNAIDPKQQQAIEQIFSLPQASQFFRFRVRADLAGRITSSTGGPEIRGGSAVWSPRFGQQLPFSATASSYNPFALVLIGVPVAALLAWVVAHMLARRRPRRPVLGWEVGSSHEPPVSGADASGPVVPPADGG